jgi:NADH-quinone oxidoreductase subunit J
MIPDLLLFSILALIAVASALGMLFSRNAVHAALYLIVNFGAVAVFYLILAASFIALVQVTVYAGAIMVLFLFVIMLLGAERMRAQTRWGRPEILAVIAGTILILEAAYIIFLRPASVPAGAVDAAALPAGFGGPNSVGMALFQQYSLPFEVTSVLLLVAMLGAIILSKRRRPAK